jgi:hypothetical protein
MLAIVLGIGVLIYAEIASAGMLYEKIRVTCLSAMGADNHWILRPRSVGKLQDSEKRS